MRNVPDIFRLPSVMASDLEKSMICTQRACWERAQQLRPVVTLLSFSFLGIQVFYIYLLSFPPPPPLLLQVFSEQKLQLPSSTLHLNHCGISSPYLKSTYQTSVRLTIYTG